MKQVLRQVSKYRSKRVESLGNHPGQRAAFRRYLKASAGDCHELAKSIFQPGKKIVELLWRCAPFTYDFGANNAEDADKRCDDARPHKVLSAKSVTAMPDATMVSALGQITSNPVSMM